MDDLTGVVLMVSDVSRSFAFYTEKLRFRSGRCAPNLWYEVVGPGISVFLVIRRPGQVVEGHGGAGISLGVPDVDKAKEELETRGIEFIGDVFNGEYIRLALFEDPDENPIYLVQVRPDRTLCEDLPIGVPA